MVFQVDSEKLQRGGPHYRRNPDRYFHVKNTGWFVYLRDNIEIHNGIEVNAGIAGPFRSKANARYYLLKLIYEERPELFIVSKKRKIFYE